MIAVLAPVPSSARALRGRARVEDLRRRAAAVVRRSAELLGAACFEPCVDEQGRPRPHRGLYWSRSHSRHFVAGVVAEHPVGIDVEGPRSLSSGAQGLLRSRLDALREPRFEPALDSSSDWADGLVRWVVLEASSKCFGLGLSGASGVHISRTDQVVRAACGSDSAPVRFRREPPLWLAVAGGGLADLTDPTGPTVPTAPWWRWLEGVCE